MNTEREAIKKIRSVVLGDSAPDDDKLIKILGIANDSLVDSSIANKPEAKPVACYTKTYGLQMLKAGFLADLPNDTLLYTAPPSTAALQKRIEELEEEFATCKNNFSQAMIHVEYWKGKVAELEAVISKKDEALNTINNWLVCAPIATAEDMAQSFGDMQSTCDKALALKAGDVQAPKEGWKLVPSEPDDYMFIMARQAVENHYGQYVPNTYVPDVIMEVIYKAMIAAAPTDTEGK